MITTELFIILSFFLSLKNSQVNISEYEAGTPIAECTSFEELIEELTVLCEEDMFDAFCSSPVYRASEKQHWLYKYKAIPFDAFYKKDSIYETYDEYIEVNED